MLTLPRTDHRLIVEQLTFLDRVKNLKEVITQQLLHGLAVGKAIQRALERILVHAEIVTGVLLRSEGVGRASMLPQIGV